MRKKSTTSILPGCLGLLAIAWLVQFAIDAGEKSLSEQEPAHQGTLSLDPENVQAPQELPPDSRLRELLLGTEILTLNPNQARVLDAFARGASGDDEDAGKEKYALSSRLATMKDWVVVPVHVTHVQETEFVVTSQASQVITGAPTIYVRHPAVLSGGIEDAKKLVEEKLPLVVSGRTNARMVDQTDRKFLVFLSDASVRMFDRETFTPPPAAESTFEFKLGLEAIEDGNYGRVADRHNVPNVHVDDCAMAVLEYQRTRVWSPPPLPE